MRVYIYLFTWLFGIIFSVASYIILQVFKFELTLKNGVANIDFILLGVAMLMANIPVFVLAFGYWIQAKLTMNIFLWSVFLGLFFCYFVIGLYICLETYELKHFKTE